MVTFYVLIELVMGGGEPGTKYPGPGGLEGARDWVQLKSRVRLIFVSLSLFFA